MKLTSRIIIIVFYLAASIWLSVPFTHFEKVFNYHLIVQFLLGPLSNLSHMAACLSFINSVGVEASFSIYFEIWIYLFLNLLIWVVSLFILLKLKVTIIVLVLLLIWGVAGSFNLYFYGIGTL